MLTYNVTDQRVICEVFNNNKEIIIYKMSASAIIMNNKSSLPDSIHNVHTSTLFVHTYFLTAFIVLYFY